MGTSQKHFGSPVLLSSPSMCSRVPFRATYPSHAPLQISQLLSLLPHLQSLTITDCTLVTTRVDAFHVPDYEGQLARAAQGLIQAAPSLTSLALASTGLETAVGSVLLKHCPGLRALDLQHPSGPMHEWLSAIRQLTGLTSMALVAPLWHAWGSPWNVPAELAGSLCNLCQLDFPKIPVDSTEALDTLLAAPQLTALTVRYACCPTDSAPCSANRQPCSPAPSCLRSWLCEPGAAGSL
jgi:hypothetical protein